MASSDPVDDMSMDDKTLHGRLAIGPALTKLTCIDFGNANGRTGEGLVGP